MTVSCLVPSSCVINVNYSNIIKVLYIKDFNQVRIILFYLLQFSGSQTERHMQCLMNIGRKRRIS